MCSIIINTDNNVFPADLKNVISKSYHAVGNEEKRIVSPDTF